MADEQISTRALAARTLHRVLNEGAYSNVIVRSVADIEAVDHGLYQRLVYETLRWLPSIDEAIERATPRSLDRIQPEVLAVLRIATAEIRHLRRAPHSAVSNAVEAVREAGKPKAAGFVNAVLRSVATHRDEAVDADRHAGLPSWLYDRVVTIFGQDARAFVEASNEPPQTGIRSRDGEQRGEGTGITGATYMPHDASVAALVRNGYVDVIDPSSVAVVNALDVQPADVVADLAAAPGGKTRAIADATGPAGMVVASDSHVRRLTTAKTRCEALTHVHWIVADADAPPLRERSFDKVLLDAPCTGLGTLRRRPEIRYRIDPDAPAAYGKLQRRLLTRALRLVRPGGRVVYSVCTVFPEETVAVVAGLGAHRPAGTDGMPFGDGVLLAPHITGTDGMFIAVFDR